MACSAHLPNALFPRSSIETPSRTVGTSGPDGVARSCRGRLGTVGLLVQMARAHGAERGRDAQRRTAYGSAIASAVPAGSGWALAARMA